MTLCEKTLEEVNEYNGEFLKLDIRTVELPNGKIYTREIIKHPGAVAIVAYIDDNTILLVEQFRNPLEKTILELPAGKLEVNEKIEDCAKRELEEETGYKSDNFTYLGKIASAPAFCDEYIYLYKAENLYSGTAGGDEDEFIKLHQVNINEALKMIKEGKIIDAKTISAFMLL